MDPKNYMVNGQIDLNLLKKQPKKVREDVQSELKKAGLYTGEVDGIIGKLSTAAVQKANSYNNMRQESPLAKLQTPVPQVAVRERDMRDSPAEGFSPINMNGFTKYIKDGSASYRDLYNAGRLMNYDSTRDEFVAPNLKEFTVSAQKPTESYNERVRKQNEYIRGSGLEKQNYAIVDKEAGTISYYGPDNKLIQSEPVITGKSKRDKDYGYSSREWLAENKGKTFKDYINYLEATDNKVTPSGRYTIGSQRNDILENPQAWYRELFNNAAYYVDGIDRNKDIAESRKKSYGDQGKLLTLVSDTHAASSKAIHGTNYPEREQALANALNEGNPDALRQSAGCINIGDKSICFNTLNKGSGVYILPEQSDDIVTKSKKKMLGTTTNAILESKRRIYDSLVKQGVKPDDRMVDFMTSVHGKESSYGNSLRASLEDLAPFAFKSRGEMQINPSPRSFGKYLPKDYEGSLVPTLQEPLNPIKNFVPSFDNQVEALYNFYTENQDATDQELYSLYNSGSRVAKNAKAKKNMRGFNQIYNRVKAAYAYGGDMRANEYAAGGMMDIAGAALGRLGQYAGQVQDIIKPTVNPDEGDYKFNWGDALTKGGILMELAKKMSMDNARSKYVMGASPGNYAKGGMISKAKAREILHDGTVHGNPITEKQRRFFGAMSSRAAGGMIADMMNPTAALDMLNQPQAVRALVTGNTNQPMKMGGVMNYAMGGDMKLSDNSFLVDGNPAVTDGNFYPQLNAKLDHGEVVKDNFVFSNKLRDPQTNVTYAKLAQPVEKSTGKAEKFMKRFQNDAFSKNTVMQNNKFLDSLSNKQEMLATAMGLRQNEQPMGYVAGGDMQGDPKNPMYMSIGTNNDVFYDPINLKLKGVDLFGGYYDVSWPRVQQEVRSQYPTLADWEKANVANIQDFKKTYYSQPSVTTSPVGDPFTSKVGNPSLAGTGTNNIPGTNMPAPTARSGGASRAKGSAKTSKAVLGDLRKAQADYEARTGYKQNPNELAYQNMLSNRQQQEAMDAWNQAGELGPVGPQSDLGFTTPNERSQMLGQMYAKNDPAFVAAMQERAGTNGVPAEISLPVSEDPSKTGKGMKQKWTAGDYMNAAAVLGRFGQLIGGPEVEKPVYDTTAITRQVYDPASALYQTNRQTSGMLNRMDVPSINARTSIANNMLAQRLNQDAQTLSSYQNMNAQGLRDYETRATEQRRYNVGQTLATNQMNAQNRAAYKQAVDNAMTSLGGFGTAMNQKTQAYDTLNILKTIYPEVYRRIIDGMNGIETPVKQTPAAQTTTTTTETAPQGQQYGGLMKGYYSGGKMKKAKKYGR